MISAGSGQPVLGVGLVTSTDMFDVFNVWYKFSKQFLYILIISIILIVKWAFYLKYLIHQNSPIIFGLSQ